MKKFVFQSRLRMKKTLSAPQPLRLRPLQLVQQELILQENEYASHQKYFPPNTMENHTSSEEYKTKHKECRLRSVGILELVLVEWEMIPLRNTICTRTQGTTQEGGTSTWNSTALPPPNENDRKSKG